MNISPINLVSFSKSFNYKNNQKNMRCNLPFDSVSFSGKKDIIKQGRSQNAKEGIAVGKKILKLARSNSLNYETLNNVINENAPVPIHIDNIKNIPNIVSESACGRIVAHMLPGYSPDFSLAAANIYLGAFPNISKEESDFAANVAHEYTHVLQRAQDNNYYGILKYARNTGEVTAIARTSKSLMDNMSKVCQQRLFSNEKVVRTVLNSILSNRFDINESLGKIDFNGIIDNVSSTLALQLNKNPEDMKNAIRGWIIQETQNEIEAYSVTLNILENSKYDPNTKASRTLSREIYSYINNSLKKQNEI